MTTFSNLPFRSQNIGLLAVAALAGVVLTLLPGTTLAARGGNSGASPSTSAATLVLPPSAPCCGGSFTGSGTGYDPSSFAYINIWTPYSLYFTSVATDAAGNMCFTQLTSEPGTYTVIVYQYEHKKLVEKARGYLDVFPLLSAGRAALPAVRSG